MRTVPLDGQIQGLLWSIPCGVPPKSVTLTTYQALKRAAKGATLKIQRDLSPKRVMERGQYQTRPPQWVTLDQRKHITKTYYQCRGAPCQHDDGILSRFFNFRSIRLLRKRQR